jgi:hypothetical protein
MNYFLNKSLIDGINFDNEFNHFIQNDAEFYGKQGEQHYRLLSYLSTQYNDCNILDIGSDSGRSALALSYNESNKVYSFDTAEQYHSPLRLKQNVTFSRDDLFDVKGREKWKDIIMSCPFIFMDVVPHTGLMEYSFYQYLKEIGYQGFVVFDDIWFFKEMRNNFWYKVVDSEKYDVTEFGHWSGTGIITFNKSVTFNKCDNSNWTLVTAYFNLTKCPDASREIIERSKDYYFSHSYSTLSLPYNLVIYCDRDSLENIENIRPAYLANKTKYVVCEFDELQFKKNKVHLDETFHDYRETIIDNREKNPYHFDNRNTASYYLFCMSRYLMLKEVIEENHFQSTHFAWINFCIERMGFKNLIHLDECLSVNRNKFSTCYIDYIPHNLIKNTKEYYQHGRCSMCSGFFTGNKEHMYKVCDLIENKFLEYLEQGYGHADEQLFSPVYFENPELFEHYYGDYSQMITNYVYVYDAPEPPIYNFIKRSYENGHYAKCVEACAFVMRSYLLEKVAINEFWMRQLKYYYTNSIMNIK